jgi:hypothetical protein
MHYKLKTQVRIKKLNIVTGLLFMLAGILMLEGQLEFMFRHANAINHNLTGIMCMTLSVGMLLTSPEKETIVIQS